MKRFLQATCLVFAAIALSSPAQAVPATPFHKGSFYLGGALGLGSGLGYLGGAMLIANAEYALTENIGIGGSVGYWSYSESLNAGGSSVKYSYSVIPIVASGAYHIPIGNSKIDLAGGVSLGYYLVSSSVDSSIAGFSYASATGSGIAWGVFGLARYFITDRMALRGKLGYGITVAEVGVDFRF